MHGKKLWAAANEGTRASSHANSVIFQCRMCEAHTVGEGILHLEDRTRGGREADEVTLPERIVVFVRRLGRSHPLDSAQDWGCTEGIGKQVVEQGREIFVIRR